MIYSHADIHAHTHTRAQMWKVSLKWENAETQSIRTPKSCPYCLRSSGARGCHTPGWMPGWRLLFPALPLSPPKPCGAGAGAPPRSAARECRRERLQLIFPLSLWKSWFNFTPQLQHLCVVNRLKHYKGVCLYDL